MILRFNHAMLVASVLKPNLDTLRTYIQALSNLTSSLCSRGGVHLKQQFEDLLLGGYQSLSRLQLLKD